MINTKDKIEDLQKSGIYKLDCGDCSVTYIGRTCRRLKVRLSEQLNKPEISAVGYHEKLNNHNFRPNKF